MQVKEAFIFRQKWIIGKKLISPLFFYFLHRIWSFTAIFTVPKLACFFLLSFLIWLFVAKATSLCKVFICQMCLVQRPSFLFRLFFYSLLAVAYGFTQFFWCYFKVAFDMTNLPFFYCKANLRIFNYFLQQSSWDFLLRISSCFILQFSSCYTKIPWLQLQF